MKASSFSLLQERGGGGRSQRAICSYNIRFLSLSLFGLWPTLSPPPPPPAPPCTVDLALARITHTPSSPHGGRGESQKHMLDMMSLNVKRQMSTGGGCSSHDCCQVLSAAHVLYSTKHVVARWHIPSCLNIIDQPFLDQNKLLVKVRVKGFFFRRGHLHLHPTPKKVPDSKGRLQSPLESISVHSPSPTKEKVHKLSHFLSWGAWESHWCTLHILSFPLVFGGDEGG